MSTPESHEYDFEVPALVDRINTTAGRVAARVIADTSAHWEQVGNVLPRVPRREAIDWNRAVSSSGPLPEEAPEPPAETKQRIEGDLAHMCRIANVNKTTHVSFLSDEFYSIGIECEESVALEVLAAWLPLPHAIYVVPANQLACLLVTFARSSYVFQAKPPNNAVNPSSGLGGF